MRGDRGRSTMSLRRKVPTVYWQAIVAHNLLFLQQGKDVALVRQYGCRSDRPERQCTGKQMRIPPFPLPPIYQKNRRVRKIFVRNSGAGNGCANLMDTWKNAFSLQGKPMSIKFLLLGGGVFWVLGGGSADFIFMGARIFLNNVLASKCEYPRFRYPPFKCALEKS